MWYRNPKFNTHFSISWNVTSYFIYWRTWHRFPYKPCRTWHRFSCEPCRTWHRFFSLKISLIERGIAFLLDLTERVIIISDKPPATWYHISVFCASRPCFMNSRVRPRDSALLSRDSTLLSRDVFNKTLGASTRILMRSAMFQIGSLSDIDDSYDGSDDHNVPFYSSCLNGPYFGNGTQFLMGRTFAKVNYVWTVFICFLRHNRKKWNVNYYLYRHHYYWWRNF